MANTTTAGINNTVMTTASIPRNGRPAPMAEFHIIFLWPHRHSRQLAAPGVPWLPRGHQNAASPLEPRCSRFFS